MLQIPSSALSLFSFSSKGLVGLLSGLCVGSQVVALVLSSSLKTEFTAVTRASRTVEIVPTRCVLSNGTLSFPYVAAMGYATLLFAGLVYILRAKGFSCDSSNGHSLPDPPSADKPVLDIISPEHNQPPSPPSDSGSSADTGRRRNRCLWILWLILLLMALVPLGIFVFFTYAHSRPVPPSLHAFKLFCVKGVSAIEATFSYIWIFASSNIPDLATHLSLHAWQCFKVLLALAGHTLWILLPVGPTVRRLRTSIAGVTWRKRVVIASLVVFIGVIAYVPGWRFLFWIPFYIAWGSPWAHQIDICIHLLVFRLSSFVGSYPIEMSMLLGPAIFHIGVLCLWKMLVTLPAIPSATKALVRRLSNPYVFAGLFTLCYWVILWWFSPRRAKYVSVRTSPTWTSTQIKDFLTGLQRAFVAGFSICCEMWGSLCWTQKLLIVTPAAVFYAHLYLIPPARRLWRIFCQWRRRLQ